MASSEALRVYAAEDALEKSSPTRALSMADATAWITTIAENEDLDPPALVRQKMSSDLLGLAQSFSNNWLSTYANTYQLHTLQN
jgi:hypothetical protein